MGIMQGFDIFIWASSTQDGRVTYPEQFDISGMPNTGSQSIQLTADSTQWNLVGNPYPSTLNWDNVNLPNDNSIYDGVYIWDPNNSQFETYVNGMGTNGGDSRIAPMQAFFVWANSGPTTLTVDNSARSTGTDEFVGKREEDQKSKISLAVSDEEGASDEMIVYFDQAATQNFDGNYDAYEFKLKKDHMPNMYSKIGDANASINGLPEIRDGLTVPVRLESGKGANYTIDASIENLEAGVEVYLEDKATGKVYDVTSSKVEVDYEANEQHAFLLKFSKNATSKNDSRQTLSNTFNVWNEGNQLKIDFGNNDGGTAQIQVLDVTGKTITKAVDLPASGIQSVDLGETSKGVYMIKVIQSETIENQKVFIRE
jgi:hypothetical protein